MVDFRSRLKPEDRERLAAYERQKREFGSQSDTELAATAELYHRQMQRSRYRPGDPVYDGVMDHVLLPELIRRVGSRQSSGETPPGELALDLRFALSSLRNRIQALGDSPPWKVTYNELNPHWVFVSLRCVTPALEVMFALPRAEALGGTVPERVLRQTQSLARARKLVEVLEKLTDGEQVELETAPDEEPPG